LRSWEIGRKFSVIEIDKNEFNYYKEEILKLKSECVQFYGKIAKNIKDYNKII
jgi:hypothetical protein